MAVHPPPRVDSATLLSDRRGRLPARHDLNVGLFLRERAPDADFGVPGAAKVLGVRLDPVLSVVFDDHNSPSRLSAASRKCTIAWSNAQRGAGENVPVKRMGKNTRAASAR